MKTLKRILSGVIATVTILTGTAIPVSAAYDDCDVNRDGLVNVSDTAAISRYLAGNLYAPDYNRFDTNNSLTIDEMDVQCVLSKVMGKSYSSSYYSRATQKCSTAPNVLTFIPNSAANTTEKREYARYSYASQKQLSKYTLYPSTTSLTSSTSSASTYSLIGEDDREVAKGTDNFGIVRLSSGGTGFIVGDHQIATAAHCVYNCETKTWAQSMSINTYKFNGEMLSTVTPVEAHIPQVYYEQGGVINDYALITVEEDLSNYVHFELGTSYSVNATNFANIPIYVTGCPGETDTDGDNSSNLLYSAEGRVVSKSSSGSYKNNTRLLNYSIDTSGGNSGSPVYTITKNVIDAQASYTYTALAIHSCGGDGTYNCGPIITKYQLQFYKNNSYANY